jgi:hypothetical protein
MVKIKEDIKNKKMGDNNKVMEVKKSVIYNKKIKRNMM